MSSLTAAKIATTILFLSIFNTRCAAQNSCFITEDATISYRTFGKGYPVLIINGGPGMSSEGFIPLAETLSEDNTTIIYDQRGTGNSSVEKVDRTTISLDKMVEDVERLRKELQCENWIILGHSFGGMLAYAYTAKYPERVTAMIQSHSGGMNLDLLSRIDITSRLTQMQRDSLNFYSAKISQGDTTHATALKRGTFLAPAYVYQEKYILQIAERLTQGNSRINSLVWEDMREIQFDTRSKMEKFKKPVLILQGKNEIAPNVVAEKAHEILPNSKLVLMDRCGHYGWLDRPDIYLKEVQKFLKKHSI